MTKTRSDLITQALKNIGFLPEGITPGAEEYQTLDSVIDPLLEELQEREILFVPEPGTLGDHNSGLFELRYFLPLAWVLADRVKSGFGQGDDQSIMLEVQKAYADIYTVEANQQPYTRKILEGQYF